MHEYNDKYKDGMAEHPYRDFARGKDDDLPRILAMCTPLMSRVHKYAQQSGELVFIDSSSSFDDYNNPMFVISTSSAAGGLPLGVVTSGESSSTINAAIMHLNSILPNWSFCNRGSPSNMKLNVKTDLGLP